jgi:N-acetylglucosaminyldiphosphoundecaprenol N-acetyl-beta-D-mannosaminyltransferase
MRSRKQTGLRLKTFLFGGGEGVAETVSKNLNLEADGINCVGTLNPGFGTIEEMSTERILRTINSSEADLLAVFLSAQKAQSWLLLNHARLRVPLRAQFGATINLQASSIKRAPVLLRRLGLEWLWRIKEEPYLWPRYWNDGVRLVTLVLTCVLPLSIGHLWRRLVTSPNHDRLNVDLSEDQAAVRLKLEGAATARNVDVAIPWFRRALDAKKDVLVDVSIASFIDARFFGLLLMVRKQLISRNNCLGFSGLTPKIKKSFRLNGFEFLLNSKN